MWVPPLTRVGAECRFSAHVGARDSGELGGQVATACHKSAPRRKTRMSHLVAPKKLVRAVDDFASSSLLVAPPLEREAKLVDGVPRVERREDVAADVRRPLVWKLDFVVEDPLLEDLLE